MLSSLCDCCVFVMPWLVDGVTGPVADCNTCLAACGSLAAQKMTQPDITAFAQLHTSVDTPTANI